MDTSSQSDAKGQHMVYHMQKVMQECVGTGTSASVSAMNDWQGLDRLYAGLLYRKVCYL